VKWRRGSAGIQILREIGLGGSAARPPDGECETWRANPSDSLAASRNPKIRLLSWRANPSDSLAASHNPKTGLRA